MCDGATRLGEALGLADIDVDLVAGVLTVRGAKFGKSRLVPVHPSVIAPLAAYRATRMKQVPNAPQSLFFVGSRGVHLGKPLSDVVLDASACMHLHGKGRKDRRHIHRCRSLPDSKMPTSPAHPEFRRP